MKHIKTYERIEDYANAYKTLQKIKYKIDDMSVKCLSAVPKREKEVLKGLDEIIKELTELKLEIEISITTNKYNL